MKANGRIIKFVYRGGARFLQLGTASGRSPRWVILNYAGDAGNAGDAGDLLIGRGGSGCRLAGADPSPSRRRAA